MVDLDYEPMDIDRSFNSDESLNVDNEPPLPISSQNKVSLPMKNINSKVTSPEVPSTLPVLKTAKKLYVKVPRKRQSSNQLFRLNGAICILMLFFGLTVYLRNTITCMEHIEVNNLQTTLSHKIFGQKNAIAKLSKALSDQSISKIIVLYGATGVGKTYAMSLILEDICEYSNVYHFTMPTFKENLSSKLMVGLIMCKSTVMIIDSLKLDETDINADLQDVISKVKNLNKNITIILIYNCININFQRNCDIHFKEKIDEKLQAINLAKIFVKFEQLQEKHLRQCIKSEIGDKNISEMKMNNVVKNFNVSLDGCKGVHSKIKLLNIL